MQKPPEKDIESEKKDFVGNVKKYICCNGKRKTNTDYWKPHGVLKMLEIVSKYCELSNFI